MQVQVILPVVTTVREENELEKINSSTWVRRTAEEESQYDSIDVTHFGHIPRPIPVGAGYFFSRGCTSLRNDGTHFLASVRARVDVDRSFIGPMGDAPPSDSPSTGDGADSRPRGDPPRDAVFATTGISPHEVPTTVPNASPLDSNDDADERATLEAHALELGSQLRATGGHLDALSAMSAESLAEILGMRGGVEAELDALRRERRRLETLAELESLKRSLAAVAEGREDQNIDPDETRARVAALVASLASLDDDDDGDAAASGLADAMRGLRTTLDGDEGDAVTSDDPSETLEDDDDDLDAAIAEMEARLVEARRTRDEMDAIRRALESEVDSFVATAAEDAGGAMGGMGEEAARAWLLAALGEDEPPEEGDARDGNTTGRRPAS